METAVSEYKKKLKVLLKRFKASQVLQETQTPEFIKGYQMAIDMVINEMKTDEFLQINSKKVMFSTPKWALKEIEEGYKEKGKQAASSSDKKKQEAEQ